jgi:hypothetical protein
VTADRRVLWARDEAVLWRRLADGVLLLPPGSDELVALSGTGAVVWEALESSMDTTELAERLAADFSTESSDIAEDVEETIRQLLSFGALRESLP